MTCPYCEASIPDVDVFCEECGRKLDPSSSAATTCPCGSSDVDSEGYCQKCGRRTPPALDPAHIAQTVSADCAGLTDRGLKHSSNEDRFGIREQDGAWRLVVCDGVSTSLNAAKASQAAVDAAISSTGDLAAAIADAAQAVAALPTSGFRGDSASTTLVAADMRGHEVTIGWVGDSRAYWISDDMRSGRLLSHDHSWVNMAVELLGLTAAQAEASPQAHAILRWLGADAGENAEAEFTTLTLTEPGLLLLCTDGLWNYAPEPVDLATRVATAAQAYGREASGIVRGLVEFARVQGGRDNITVVVWRYQG